MCGELGPEATHCFRGLEGGEDTGCNDTRPWDDTVCQVPVSPEHHMAGQFSDRDHIRCFLKLDRLLVNKGTPVMKNNVWVHWAILCLPLGGWAVVGN